MKMKIRPRYRLEPQEVNFRRWLEYYVGMRLERIANRIGYALIRFGQVGNRMQWHAIDPDDEVPF
jgi:hypothetical protein